MLYPGERLDEVNDKIRLIQKTDGLVFGTDALLLAGYVNGNFDYGAEFGSGSGIVSLLLLTRGKAGHMTALDIQPEYAELTCRNAQLNGLGDRLCALCCDVRDFRPQGELLDLIVTNPPYMTVRGGYANRAEGKNIARHEVHGGIGDFLTAAGRSLRYGGTFAAVYRPDRLCDLLCAMREAKIEPKRMTFVHADENSPSSMVLILGKRGGKPGMKLTPPLLLYTDRSHHAYGTAMQTILNEGIFPPVFR